MACNNDLEVIVTFEACNHVPHMVSAMQEIIELGLINDLHFRDIEHCPGCDVWAVPHATVWFNTKSRERGDAAAGLFEELEGVLEALCGCICGACVKEPVTDGSNVTDTSKVTVLGGI